MEEAVAEQAQEKQGTGEVVLAMRGISKAFPGVQALDNVDFELRRGEIHALLGENGAGKSTLIKILSGAYSKDAGEIIIRGQPVEIANPLAAMRLGVAVIYQEFNLVPQLSVAENVLLGHEPFRRVRQLIDFATMRRQCQQYLDAVGAEFSPDTLVKDLSVAERQLTEIAKALSLRGEILVLDEPTATLTDREIERLFSVLRQLAAEGKSIIYVSHRLQEVHQICDRVTVLRDGKKVATLPVSEASVPKLIRLMVGRSLDEQIPKAAAEIGAELLRVEGLTSEGHFYDVSLTVRHGEIVGLAGLVGAGRTEIAKAIFGALPVQRGRVFWEGREVRIRSPQEAVRLGIALLTEDRKEQGLVLGLPVSHNITLPSLRKISTPFGLSLSREREEAERLVEELDVRPRDIRRLVRYLSGGNQQKVVLAKWLFSDARLVLFDEPTRGIDVGAKREIHQLIGRLVQRGVGVLLISSEMPEILGLCDRIYVVREGRIAGELAREEADQVKVLSLAMGEAA